MATDNDKKKEAFTPVNINSKPSSTGKKKGALLAKIPQMRLAAGPEGLLARLKKLTRRDLAFIVAGISVLIMLPMAEHFMMGPSSDNVLSPGFGSRGGTGPAGELYEPGTGGFAPGAAGDTGDVITPLSARDPSSLIMSPSGPSKPPAPPLPKSEGFRDALKDASRSAVSEAVRSSGVPTPRSQMQGALRGLGALGGSGSSSSAGIPGAKILQTAQDAPAKAASRSSLGPVAMAGYKGVGQQSLSSSGRNSFEQLKSKAGSAADHMNESSAARALDRAAQDSVQAGAGTGGTSGPSAGAKDSKPGDSSVKDSKSFGESLEMMRQKMLMQKQLELEWKMKELWGFELPKMGIMALANGVQDSLVKPFFEAVKGKIFPDAKPPTYICYGKVPNPPDPKNECFPLDKATNIKEGPKDDILKFRDAATGNCPCGAFAKPKDAAAPGSPAPAVEPPAVPPNESAGANLDNVISQSAEVFKNLDNNVAEAGASMEVGAYRRAYSYLDGAILSAGAALNSVHSGINVVRNNRASFAEKISSVEGLAEPAGAKIREARVSGIAPVRYESLEAGKRMYSDPNKTVGEKYNRLITEAKNIDDLEKMVRHNKRYERYPLAINAAMGKFLVDLAESKVDTAAEFVEKQKNYMARVRNSDGSIGAGLDGAMKSRDEIGGRISKAKELLETIPQQALDDPDPQKQKLVSSVLRSVQSEFTGKYRYAPDGDIEDTPVDDPGKPAPGIPDAIKTLLGNDKEKEKETADSRKYLNDDKGSSAPDAPGSLIKMSVRHDVIKEQTAMIGDNLTDGFGGFLSLAATHAAEASKALKYSRVQEIASSVPAAAPSAAPERMSDKGEAAFKRTTLPDGTVMEMGVDANGAAYKRKVLPDGTVREMGASQ